MSTEGWDRICNTLASLQAQINNLSFMLQGQGHDQWYVYNDGQKREITQDFVHCTIQSADIYFKFNNVVIQLIIDGKQINKLNWGEEVKTEPHVVGFYSHDIADINPIKCMKDMGVDITKSILETAKKEAIPISITSVPMQNFYARCKTLLKVDIHNL